jgi:hypothetical protein
MNRLILMVILGLLAWLTAAEAQTPPTARQSSACPAPGPACPAGQAPICNDGIWYCRLHAASGARSAGLNFPTAAQRQEGACGDPALACEVPAIPACRNGTWICVPPARATD